MVIITHHSHNSFLYLGCISFPGTAVIHCVLIVVFWGKLSSQKCVECTFLKRHLMLLYPDRECHLKRLGWVCHGHGHMVWILKSSQRHAHSVCSPYLVEPLSARLCTGVNLFAKNVGWCIQLDRLCAKYLWRRALWSQPQDYCPCGYNHIDWLRIWEDVSESHVFLNLNGLELNLKSM